MARYLVATHRATLTRDWLCTHCHAAGHATVRATGKGEKRLWFSRSAAAEVAHDRAAVALERDGDRIVSLVRCPKCRSRQPGAALATLWYGLGEFFLALFAGAIAGVLVAAKLHSVGLPIAAGAFIFVLVLAIGDERRRWTEAGRAEVELIRKPIAPQRAPATAASVDATPFRAPPAPPPIAVVRPPTDSRAPIVAGDPSDKPTFLH